ncbi:hypothetical protein AAFF_G00270250 [Aldrovandia affinis]|uniref:FISNA domain-containing protein n=1 Tax=Aldrovandia affinis TaxID=143900 RepID=A0AAD7RBD4_9TELE|nr:hypothetical protein AAFF_G00270250 [Aldrovandia affinis]
MENRAIECLRTAQEAFKSKLKTKFQSILEGIAKHGNPTLLNSIPTELYITEGDRERSGDLKGREESWVSQIRLPAQGE